MTLASVLDIVLGFCNSVNCSENIRKSNVQLLGQKDWVKLKIKVKSALEQAMKALRGSRGIAPLFP